MSEKIQIGNFWYEIVLWDTSDYLYHAYIYRDNQYNQVHTTSGYLSFSDCTIAVKAIIEFMLEQQEN